MSYAIDIETMFDGQIGLHLPGVGRLAMSPPEAVAVGLALLKEAGDTERVDAWLDWLLVEVDSIHVSYRSTALATASVGIMEGLPVPEADT